METTSTGDVRYFEDYVEGMQFGSGSARVSSEDIVRFAREFDPQPFHTDPEAAKASFFGTHVASGWHCAAMTMRLLVGSNLSVAGGLVGAGGEIKWPSVLRPGDEIHVEIEVTGKRPLRSRTDVGLLTTRARTINQDGSIVQELVANLLVPRRNG